MGDGWGSWAGLLGHLCIFFERMRFLCWVHLYFLCWVHLYSYVGFIFISSGRGSCLFSLSLPYTSREFFVGALSFFLLSLSPCSRVFFLLSLSVETTLWLDCSCGFCFCSGFVSSFRFTGWLRCVSVLQLFPFLHVFQGRKSNAVHGISLECVISHDI